MQPPVQNRILELTRVYRTARERLQERLTAAALTDFRKFRYGELLAQVQLIVTALDVEASQAAAGTVPAAYREGADLAAAAIRQQGGDVLKLNLGNRLHMAAIQAVSDQMTLDLLSANQSIGTNCRRILRATQQKLIAERQVNQIIAQGLVEGETRRQVSTALETKLQEQLADGQFVTINGRNYPPDYYAESVARTRTREAVTHGTIGAMAEHGVDLVQIDVHDDPCPVCQEREGKVYSISGADPEFPPLDQRPPYHPNCECVLLPFIREAFTQAELTRVARV